MDAELKSIASAQSSQTGSAAPALFRSATSGKSRFEAWLATIVATHNQPGHGEISVAFKKQTATETKKSNSRVTPKPFEIESPRSLVVAKGYRYTFSEDMKTYVVERLDNNERFTGVITDK